MRLKLWLAAATTFAISPTLAQTPPLTADGGFLATPIANCNTDLRYLNQVGGWQLTWPREWEGVASGGDIDAALARWAPAPDVLAAARGVLAEGVAAQETAPRAAVTRVHQQVRDLTTDLSERDPKYFVAGDEGEAWNDFLTSKMLPALQVYESFLRTTYLPAARANPGMSDWEGGADCFKEATLWWTTLDLPSEDIERIGERILDETRAELMATAEDGETFEDVMTRLRKGQAEDETTAEELIALSEAALLRAEEKTLTAFNHKAEIGIVVTEMAAHIQDSFPAGYYQRPAGDAPAAYVINPSRPGERRLMAEVIAFHEGAPGHHLFFAYPREHEFSGYNAGLLEGWAIYAEYLADEMALYSSNFDRQGMIAKHLWAASRLVVEPGLHLRGWSRDDAISFMLENTLLSRAEIEIEVDRYIAMPGQSLSYMLGADYILQARRNAREVMGDDFDLRGFHDAILAPGVQPLPQVGENIKRWAEGG